MKESYAGFNKKVKVESLIENKEFTTEFIKKYFVYIKEEDAESLFGTESLWSKDTDKFFMIEDKELGLDHSGMKFTLLTYAMLLNKIKLVEELIDKGAEVKHLGYKIPTPSYIINKIPTINSTIQKLVQQAVQKLSDAEKLQIAVQMNDETTIDSLIKSIHAEKVEEYSTWALNWALKTAITNNRTDLFKKLLSEGAQVNDDVISSAIGHGVPRTLRKLLEEIEDYPTLIEKIKPSMKQIDWWGAFNMVGCIVETLAKARKLYVTKNPKLSDDEMFCLYSDAKEDLCLAARHTTPAKVEKLLEYAVPIGAAPIFKKYNLYDITPGALITDAAQEGNLAMVTYLLEKTNTMPESLSIIKVAQILHVNHKKYREEEPLTKEQIDTYLHIVKQLLEKQAKYVKHDPLYVASRYQEISNEKYNEIIKRHKFKLEQFNTAKKDLLYAINKENVAAIDAATEKFATAECKYVLEKFEDLKFRESDLLDSKFAVLGDQVSPLLVAAATNNYRIFQKFLTQGFKLNNSFSELLEIATLIKDEVITETLIKGFFQQQFNQATHIDRLFFAIKLEMTEEVTAILTQYPELANKKHPELANKKHPELGITPVNMVIKSENAELSKIVFKFAKVDPINQLFQFLKTKNVEQVKKLLLQYQELANKKHPVLEKTPLNMAIESKNDELLQCVVEAIVKLGDGELNLKLIRMAVEDEGDKLLTYLMQAGMNIEPQMLFRGPKTFKKLLPYVELEPSIEQVEKILQKRFPKKLMTEYLDALRDIIDSSKVTDSRTMAKAKAAKEVANWLKEHYETKVLPELQQIISEKLSVILGEKVAMASTVLMPLAKTLIPTPIVQPPEANISRMKKIYSTPDRAWAEKEKAIKSYDLATLKLLKAANILEILPADFYLCLNNSVLYPQKTFQVFEFLYQNCPDIDLEQTLSERELDIDYNKDLLAATAKANIGSKWLADDLAKPEDEELLSQFSLSQYRGCHREITMLDGAIKVGNLRIVKFLLEKGAKIHQTHNSLGRSIESVVNKYYYYTAKYVREFLKLGEAELPKRFDRSSEEYTEPFAKRTDKSDYIKYVKECIELGEAEAPEKLDNLRQTAIDAIEIFKILLNHGAQSPLSYGKLKEIASHKGFIKNYYKKILLWNGPLQELYEDMQKTLFKEIFDAHKKKILKIKRLQVALMEQINGIDLEDYNAEKMHKIITEMQIEKITTNYLNILQSVNTVPNIKDKLLKTNIKITDNLKISPLAAAAIGGNIDKVKELLNNKAKISIFTADLQEVTSGYKIPNVAGILAACSPGVHKDSEHNEIMKKFLLILKRQGNYIDTQDITVINALSNNLITNSEIKNLLLEQIAKDLSPTQQLFAYIQLGDRDKVQEILDNHKGKLVFDQIVALIDPMTAALYFNKPEIFTILQKADLGYKLQEANNMFFIEKLVQNDDLETLGEWYQKGVDAQNICLAAVKYQKKAILDVYLNKFTDVKAKKLMVKICQAWHEELRLKDAEINKILLIHSAVEQDLLRTLHVDKVKPEEDKEPIVALKGLANSIIFGRQTITSDKSKPSTPKDSITKDNLATFLDSSITEEVKVNLGATLIGAADDSEDSE